MTLLTFLSEEDHPCQNFISMTNSSWKDHEAPCFTLNSNLGFCWYAHKLLAVIRHSGSSFSGRCTELFGVKWCFYLYKPITTRISLVIHSDKTIEECEEGFPLKRATVLGNRYLALVAYLTPYPIVFRGRMSPSKPNQNSQSKRFGQWDVVWTLTYLGK